MKNINFDIEEINGNTDYIYKFKTGAPEAVSINNFVHFMLVNNNIKCFHSYSYEINGGQRQLRYSVSHRVSLAEFTKNRFRDISSAAGVIVQIMKILLTAEEYMIEKRFILFDPDYMFIDVNTGNITVMCIPTNDAEDCSLSEFMRSVIMPMNFDGAALGDSLKVAVYQYPFDSAEITNAIEYFSEYEKGKISGKQTASGSAANVPAQEAVPAGVQAAPAPSAVHKEPAAPQPAQSASAAALGSLLGKPRTPDTDAGKNKKGGLFDRIGGKKTKEKTKPAEKKQPENPFGINVPGSAPAQPASTPFANIAVPQQDNAQSEQSSKGGLFAGLSRSGDSKAAAKAAAPEPAPAPAPAMRIDSGESTVFLNEGGDTVFMGDSGDTVFMGGQTAYISDTNGNRYEIRNSTFVIGRSGRAGIKIDLDLQAKTVSHYHATIFNDSGMYFISDNGSSNGTFVNGRRISPNEGKVPIENNTRIRISNLEFVFEIV